MTSQVFWVVVDEPSEEVIRCIMQLEEKVHPDQDHDNVRWLNPMDGPELGGMGA